MRPVVAVIASVDGYMGFLHKKTEPKIMLNDPGLWA
jgi:hypothetical protein